MSNIIRKLSGLGLTILLFLTLVLGAQAQEVTPGVTVNDQAVVDSTVTVTQVVSDGPGWIVIHARENGKPGPVIGHTAVSGGENTDVVVEIEVAEATETLYAMLHTDAGEVGTYEFPGDDTPVQVGGEVVSPAFKVTGGITIAPPSVFVVDQRIVDGKVIIAEVVSDGPGWIVIHAQADGKPGPVIGHTAVFDGVNTSLEVDVDMAEATETLYAMLHTDAGEVGTYEFPGADVPVQVEGKVVSPAFNQIQIEGKIGLELMAEGLAAPVVLIPSGDGSGRLFIVDQMGQIRILGADGKLFAEPFLDLRDRMVELRERYDERGLLGLAFHPTYKENGRFFVYYSAPLRADAPSDWDHTSHVSEFRVSSEDPNKADPTSERIILQVDQPQGNHDGGQITFGPDGYLYIPLGDGGRANDVGIGHPPIGNGQDTSNLLGSILRIDIDNGDPYGIPADNPFVNGEGREEIFAFGFRNPFHISFDTGGNHELFVGDAGQNLWEEVDIVTKGNNYGWNIKEGTHCFDPENPSESPSTCPTTDASGQPLIDPVIEFPNGKIPGGLSRVVVGGYVYRGSMLPEFEGKYIFGGWSTSFTEPNGTLLIATPPASGERMWSVGKLEVATNAGGRLGMYLVSFGQDAAGEVYVLASGAGGPGGTAAKVFKIVPAPTGMPAPEATAKPSVTVNDQAVVDSTVTVAEVISDGPGWIVIHAQENGKPGPVIGHTAVSGGENTDVMVEVDVAQATETLYAMLHTDAGEVGTYEFPGDDTPVQVDGQVVTPSFQVTEGLPGMLPGTGGSSAPWATVSLMLLVVGALALASGLGLKRIRRAR